MNSVLKKTIKAILFLLFIIIFSHCQTSEVFYTATTPGEQNIGTQADAPTITLISGSTNSDGTYYEQITVQIDAPSAGNIIYTTDNSTPSANTDGTANNGTALTPGGTINLDGNLTDGTQLILKAIAWESGKTDSNVTSSAYVFKCAPPELSLADGTSHSSGDSGTITSLTTGSTIRISPSKTKDNASTEDYTTVDAPVPADPDETTLDTGTTITLSPGGGSSNAFQNGGSGAQIRESRFKYIATKTDYLNSDILYVGYRTDESISEYEVLRNPSNPWN